MVFVNIKNFITPVMHYQRMLEQGVEEQETDELQAWKQVEAEQVEFL